MGDSGKDAINTGAQRKARLAAELRANLRRRKAKTKARRAPRGAEAEKPDAAGGR